MVNLLSYSPAVGEINNEPSLTQPDMSHSIDYYINRFRSGLPVTGSQPLYDDDLGFDGSLVDNPDSDDLTYRRDVSSVVSDVISDSESNRSDGSDEDVSASDVDEEVTNDGVDEPSEDVSNNTP